MAWASDSEWTMLRNREAFGWVDIVSALGLGCQCREPLDRVVRREVS